MNDAVPFACDMSALSSEQRSRYRELAKTLQALLPCTHELSDGYEFEFSLRAEAQDALTEITPLERVCCPFFDVSIRLEREGGKLWWRLTGRDGVKQLIQSEFSSWFRGQSL